MLWGEGDDAFAVGAEKTGGHWTVEAGPAVGNQFNGRKCRSSFLVLGASSYHQGPGSEYFYRRCILSNDLRSMLRAGIISTIISLVCLLIFKNEMAAFVVGFFAVFFLIVALEMLYRQK